VKSSLLLERIADLEKIEVSDEEVNRNWKLWQNSRNKRPKRCERV